MRTARIVLVFASLACFAPDALAADDGSAAPWWAWPVALFVACFLLGIIAVPAGVGGGVLFVPIVSGFFPFHLDFVRGAGLLVALAGALSAGPRLLQGGLAHLRLALPMALVASASSIVGAKIGLAMPATIVQVALGITILGIVALMATVRGTELPGSTRPDALSQALALHGIFRDGATGKEVSWRAHRAPLGLLLFVGIGILAGMFGLGAGWANLPTLNLVMGVPLKVSAGTSSFILSLVDSSAAWIYIHEGAVLPIVAAPSVIGMMLGARIGAKVLHVVPAALIRRLVMVLLLFAGIRALGEGMGPVDVTRLPEPHERYARWLAWGARLGFVMLVAGFAAYVLGFIDPHVPIERLPDLWRRSAPELLREIGLRPGWGWAELLHRSDMLTLVGIGVLAICALPCLAAVVPLFRARGERILAAICVLQILVLALAASGWLTVGH